MQRIGIRQLKDRDLSRAIRRAQRGEELIVTDRGVPVARIVPIAQMLEYRAPLWEKMAEPIPLRSGKKTAVMYVRDQRR